MSIHRLRTLIAIAESGSFVAAADIVSLTAAAVGQQVKALEDEFGVSLFDRNKRSPQLTPIGRALIPKARELITAYENLVPSLLDNLKQVQEMSIGAVPTTMTGLVPKSLIALRKDYSNLHIRIVPGLSADLLPLVERGYLDAAIISEPRHVQDHLQFRAFASEPLIFIAPSASTLTQPQELLETFPFIRFNRRAWVGQQIDDWLIEKKLKVNESMELDTLEAISTLVFHGLGVSIVPKRCVPSHRPLPLTRIPLKSAKPRLLGILSRPDNVKFKLIDIFLAEITKLVELAGEVHAQKVNGENKGNN